VLDHLSIQCADPVASRDFYERVLAPIGGKTIMDFGDVFGLGVEFPCFWLGPVGDAGAPHTDVHICFRARSREQVDAFVEAARTEGAEVLHEPRVWPEYHPGYYGGFVRDPDGNNVEAVHHTF
jgi:catechol 2,3-dioxygenase-like lactoylglutathione lyase family enzyme